MSSKNTSLDRFIDDETHEQKTIRAKLRLSDRWRVVGNEVSCNFCNYSDEHPDVPELIFVDGAKQDSKRLGSSVIQIEMRHRLKHLCPSCCHSCSAYEYVTREYTHIHDMGYDCKLVVSLPKLDCKCCGGKHQVRFPAARPDVSFTKEFEKTVLSEVCSSPMTKVAEKLNVGRWIVDDIVRYHVDRALPEQDLSEMNTLFVDEIQFGHGHNYVTVFSDQTRRVVYMVSGKGQDTIGLFVDYLKMQGGHPDNIWVVSADMRSAFEAGVERYLPNATLVWDRYHLVQAMNNDLNTIRKSLLKRRKGEKLRHIKYTVLRHPCNMDEEDEARLSEIRMKNPDLALAFDMKEAFCEILDNTDMYEAQQEFEEWYAWVMLEGCEVMKARADKFMRKIERILAWFDHRVNNGVAESINSRIKKTVAQACGYRSLRNFISICLFRHGRLTIRV